ncbi:hypothetical protein CWE08_07315 [Aliidiomarina iranensis]|uniref:DUF5666 domain-containing protein n=1 Tax=Aliidiomarina iranensis TaxID=1434071 RepID=A0A432VWH6_9GAMM|nr:DUF5666 domain-containing protein [Aliidiomarina iranensis]RUO20903.1 hypothetical protein CWE08_07315 [Aliidiomarina iranensis]
MRYVKPLITLALAAALSACGGGSSSETSTPNPDTGSGGGGGDPVATTTVISEGVITGFGSVYVNGQRYRSENAVISIAGVPAADEAQLKVGMVVKVSASSSDDGEDPEASEISYEEHLQGPISFIDKSTQVITVLGQRIVYDDLTKFDDTNIDMLSVNDFIEVSGYQDQDGDFYATLIELEDDQEIKVRGEVASLDTEAGTFVINGLTIDYNTALFDDMSASDLIDGFFVKVEGTDFDGDTQTLVAESIENKNDNDIDADIDEVKAAGIVRDYDAEAGTFRLNRFTVVVNDATEFDDGTIETLANGVIVKVEGEYVDGQLVAEEVEFKAQKSDTKTEGQVTDINTDARSFTVNGLVFTVNQNTRYEDDSELDDRQFNFDKIQVNDWLEVAAATNDAGEFIALKVERIDEDDFEGEVKGVARDVTETGMFVAGVAVTFTEGTHFDTEEDRITLEEFLTLIDEENVVLVEVEGEYESGVLVAKEVEIEMPSDGNDDNLGRVEFEGSVEAIEGNSVFVVGNELRFNDQSDLEINDQEVTVEEFIAALSVGSVIEVEGVWRDNSYIMVLEAELETDDDDNDD